MTWILCIHVQGQSLPSVARDLGEIQGSCHGLSLWKRWAVFQTAVTGNAQDWADKAIPLVGVTAILRYDIPRWNSQILCINLRIVSPACKRRSNMFSWQVDGSFWKIYFCKRTCTTGIHASVILRRPALASERNLCRIQKFKGPLQEDLHALRS